jgi:hypothetical protein
MSLPERIAGGCACGAVRFEGAGPPLAMLNCHCRDCQRAGGAPYAATVFLSAEAFTSAGDTLNSHEAQADSGNLVWRYFCGRCGSPLFARTSGRNDRVAVRAASLDDSSWFRASNEGWTRSALPWDALAPPPERVPTLQPPG